MGSHCRLNQPFFKDILWYTNSDRSHIMDLIMEKFTKDADAKPGYSCQRMDQGKDHLH